MMAVMMMKMMKMGMRRKEKVRQGGHKECPAINIQLQIDSNWN